MATTRDCSFRRTTVLLLLSLLVSTPSSINAFSSSSPPQTSSSSIVIPQDLPNINAAVIVPGFLTGAPEFEPLADALRKRGIPTTIVPMPNWHWLACIGGRSVRPMLERIDHAVRHVAAVADRKVTKKGEVLIPPIGYNLLDCWKDFRENPGGVLEVGGTAEVDEYPHVTPRGTFPPAPPPRGKVALIGHSAGGWISRVYLSRRPFGGKAYNGQDLVHSLVTLGSPHGNAPGLAFKGVEWINREPLPEAVRALAVGGTGYPGDRSGQLTQDAYAFCCPLGTDGTCYDGDGLTPIDSSLSMEGAETLVLDGVTHFPWSDVFGGEAFAPDLAKLHKEGAPWYGSDDIIDQWAKWLVEGDHLS